jgi:phospholipid transport system substrate-binding protein
VKEYREFLTRVYVTAMVNYTDEIVSHARNISYPETFTSAMDSRARVRTELRFESGVGVDVDYHMHSVHGQWKIYDVSVGGMSLVLANRQTLSEQIARSGMDGVIDELAARNEAKR